MASKIPNWPGPEQWAEPRIIRQALPDQMRHVRKDLPPGSLLHAPSEAGEQMEMLIDGCSFAGEVSFCQPCS
jgi:hypothetical protein